MFVHAWGQRPIVGAGIDPEGDDLCAIHMRGKRCPGVWTNGDA